MGKDVSQVAFTREDRIRYRQKVRRCLDVFALMLDDFGFDADRPMTGLEIELNLIDARRRAGDAQRRGPGQPRRPARSRPSSASSTSSSTRRPG